MRLSEDKIKAGILHPDQAARESAVMHFSRSFCDDPTVLPLVIQAIQQYGFSDVFGLPSVITGLPLSEESLPWIVQQVQREDLPDGFRTRNLDLGWRWVFQRLLREADPLLLGIHQSEILGIRGLADEDNQAIQLRIGLLGVDPDDCWGQLESLALEAAQAGTEPNLDLANAFVEAIARRPEPFADRVLAVLADTFNDVIDVDEAAAWRELFMISLSGQMRLAAAVPHLVARLRRYPEEDDLAREACEQSLVRIGTDGAVDAAASLLSHADMLRRMSASHILERIPSDLAVARALEAIPHEEDLTVRACLGEVLVCQFAYEGVEPVRQLILSDSYDSSFADLRVDLVAAAALMDVDLPEKDRWLAAAEKDRHERQYRARRQAEYEPADLADEEPIPVTAKIGRNDPCPCGSGKKYKKCCMHKHSQDDLFDEP